MLTQYFDTTANISSQIAVTSYIDGSIAAPKSINDTKIREEMAHAISVNGWKREPDAQFIVVPAPGSSYEAAFATGFCAYHSIDGFGSAYSFVPYAGDEPFASSCLGYDAERNVSHVTSMLASHEYAETVTDPTPGSGWVDAEGFELGDICATHDESLPSGAYAQGLWDEHALACNNADAGVPQVYALTEEATGATSSALTFHGTVNAEALESKFFFRFGSVPFLLSNSTPEVGFGSGRAMTGVSETVAGLEPERHYYFRICAKNATGETCGFQLSASTL